MTIDESIARAAATSGGAVFFAGGTVTIALVSLAVAGIPLVTTMGLMAAIAVVVAVLGALTLLPADARASSARGSTRCGCATCTPRTHAKNGLWAKWAHEIAKQPIDRGARRAGDPDPADDPAALADPRPAGHGGAVEVDDRAPGL